MKVMVPAHLLVVLPLLFHQLLRMRSRSASEGWLIRSSVRHRTGEQALIRETPNRTILTCGTSD
jgi:hypothetical protein